jgi:hypothetical protein
MNTNNIQQRCETLVVALVGQEKSFDWWLTPNRAFDMQTPEVMFHFFPTAVYEYLMRSANE